jgi:predicted Ser/Thr protein kinase
MSPEEAASFALQLRNAEKLAKATKQELYGYEWRNGSLRLGKILAKALAEAAPVEAKPRRRSAMATEHPKPSQGQLL